MIRRDEATEMQVRAASPETSTWLSANAGSGKTRVLTDRVARLLLDGVLPQHILCLTYTKAAASEMQNRLFERLGKWAMQDSDELALELKELGVERKINKEELRKARRLFARAIETPGGLKIQTIHSFCASILRRFPLEAGVSPQFKEMEDRAAKLLRADIIEEMANSEHVSVIKDLAVYHFDSDLEKLTAEVSRHQNLLGKKPDTDAIWRMFGLGARADKSSIYNNVILGNEKTILQSVLPFLKKGKATDITAATKIENILHNPSGLALIEELGAVFLTQAGVISKRGVPTKDVSIALGDLFQPLEDLKTRVEQARDLKNSLYSAQKTLALHNFAEIFLPLYAKHKMQRGWLDFDDLILRTANLLNDQSVAQWVLFRLDGGIDHILVDEAQDTSPQQWDVIQRLAQEFTAGQGVQRDRLRTIFVVGDKKQSIYSFQGADPDEFDRMQAHFSQKLSDVNTLLNKFQLKHSFRSSEPIMRLVNSTFQEHADLGMGDDTKHIAFKSEMPGRVDLWPIIEQHAPSDQKAWHDPIDQLANNHETIILAGQIAENIYEMCNDGSLISQEIGNSGKYEMRRISEGDFLILVRSRKGLFHEIIRACKSAGLAIAGADRLKVGAELAVKDLTALLSFLATPEDDLSLAAVLRSPLFGWDEQALFSLAHNRKKGSFLWAALRNQKTDFKNTLEILNDLRKNTDYMRPYELLERILTRFNGRKNLLARLGDEAEDGIDALLDQAMSYEHLDVPSLTGFITWLQSEEVEIKRQVDSAGDQIRVMTVHGAKGLESPIVILPDTAEWKLQIRDQIYKTDCGVMWQVAQNSSPKIMNEARDKLRGIQEKERMRLLYVAMTRAEKWLIVCGAGKLAKDSQCWHKIIEAGMNKAGAEPYNFKTGIGLRLQSENWQGPLVTEKPVSKDAKPTLPNWAKTQADIPDRPSKPLSPSMLGGAKALYDDGEGLSEKDAMKRGSQIHLLLEHLPNCLESDWLKSAKLLLPEATGAEFQTVFNEVCTVLTKPELMFMFKPGTLSEVPVSANITALGGQRIYGEIDRLIISSSHILAVDFKSNAIIPGSANNIPDGILRQLGAYQAALETIYPEHIVETAILWTHNASLMRIKREAVIAALHATTVS